MSYLCFVYQNICLNKIVSQVVNTCLTDFIYKFIEFNIMNYLDIFFIRFQFHAIKQRQRKNTNIYISKNQIAHQTVQEKTLRIEVLHKYRSFQIPY